MDPPLSGDELAVCGCDTASGSTSWAHFEAPRLLSCGLGLVISAHRAHGSRPEGDAGDRSLYAWLTSDIVRGSRDLTWPRRKAETLANKGATDDKVVE